MNKKQIREYFEKIDVMLLNRVMKEHSWICSPESIQDLSEIIKAYNAELLKVCKL